MGQDITYEAGEAVYEYRLSRADWQLIESLREHLPNEMDALFSVASLGDVVRIHTATMLSAADSVTAFVESNKDALPYTYQFKEEIPPDPQMTPGFSTGGMSGIRLPGDTEHYFCIWAGLNECRLEKSAIGSDGRGFKVDEQDLRGQKELLTTNMGKITIRRTRAKTELIKELAKIQRFLHDVSAPEVTKCVS